MTSHQAKQYFFNRIRIQILKAQVVERLARFESELDST